MAVDVSKIPNNRKFDPVREAILELESQISGGGGGGISLTDLSVTQLTASGTGTLTYDNTTGIFTYTPPVFDTLTGDVQDFVTFTIENTYDDNLANNGSTGAELRFDSASNNFFIRNYAAPSDLASDHKTEFISTAGSSYFVFSPSASEAMRITSAGNIGIGTSTPYAGAAIHIDGNGNGTAEIRIEETTNTLSQAISFKGDAAVDRQLIAYNSANTSYADEFSMVNSGGDITFRVDTLGGSGIETMRISAANANVGIGTTAPNAAAKLHVKDNDGAEIRIEDTTANLFQVLRFVGDAGTEEKFVAGYNSTNPTRADELALVNSGGDIVFYTGTGGSNVEALRIDSAGDVDFAGQLIFSGGLAMNANDAISFENGKHWITYNDGGVYNDFNIRVGHYNNSSNVEECTEAGYIMHDEWIQSLGQRQFLVSDASMTVGGLIGTNADWRLAMQYTPDTVILYYQGNERLRTTSAGVSVTGTLDFTGNITLDNGASITSDAGAQLITTNVGETWTVRNGGGSDPILTLQDSLTNVLTTFDSNGYLGIGTTSPQAPLHVIAASTANGALIQEWSYSSSSQDQYSLMLKQTVTSGVVRYNFSMVNNNTAYDDVLVLDRGNVGIGTTSPDAKLTVLGAGIRSKDTDGDVGFDFYQTSSGGLIRMRDNKPVAIYTNNAERMRVAADGKIGINTTSPAYGLDVQTTLRMRDVGQRISFDTTGSADSVQLYTANNYEFWIDNARGNSSRLILGNSDISLGTSSTKILTIDTASNRVGINNTVPSYALDVGSGGVGFRTSTYLTNAPLYSYDTSSGTYLQFYNVAGLGYLTMTGSQNLAIQTGGGNLGVNATSPTQKLEVNGTGLFTGTSLSGNTQNGVYIYDQNIYSLAGGSARPLNIRAQYLAFHTGLSYSQKVIIDADGQVGINEANPSALLHITNNETSDLTHLLLENTDAGFAQAPNLALYRNSSSPAANDALGNILFYGKNASGTQVPYAEIFSEIVDTSAGAHDGRLVFYNYINGSGDYSMVLSGRKLGIGVSSPATNLHIRNTGATALKLENFGTANWMIGVPSGQTYLAFDNVNNNLSAPKVVINSSGYLGLNTTSPSYLLDVNGGAAFRSSSYALDSTFYAYNTTSGVYLGFVVGTDGRGYLGTTASEDLVLNSSGGNVGIGTSSPSTNLEVYDSANPTLRLQTTGTTNQGSIQFGDTADADVGIINYVHDTNKMRFFTNASEQMVINGDGKVGINAQNPNYQLEVVRDGSNSIAHFYTTNSPSAFVNIGTSANTSFANIGLTNDNGTAQIWNAGSTYPTSWGGPNSINHYAPSGVSIHFHSNATANQMVLSTAGTLSVKGDIVGYSSSDKALKDNVKPIEDALEKISKIGGYEFDWNDEQDVYEGHDVGVIAQEIEDVLPEVVTTRDNGYKAVKYEKLAPLLIQAIKEQQELIEDLQAEIRHIKTLF